mgnify:CR=1 FL=1
MKKFFVFFLILGFSLECMNLFSEERNALLIANDKYPFGNLANPAKEAKELKKTLEKLDFKVTVVENGDIDKMESSIEKFGAMLKEKGGIGFFHYGGHAIQVGGKNYLIPANTQMTTENQIRRLSLDLDELMEKMQAETNIVILDACRNNPLPSSTRSVATRGLVLSSVKPKNSIIVYSADAGNVAQDGVFTPILTKKLLEKKSLHSILMDVRSEVYEKTDGQQTPKNDDGLMKEIYLAGKEIYLAGNSSKSSRRIIDWKDRQSGVSIPDWVIEFESGMYSRVNVDRLLDTKNKLLLIASCRGEDMADVVEWLSLLDVGTEFASQAMNMAVRKTSEKQVPVILAVYNDFYFSDWKKFKTFWCAINNGETIKYTYWCIWTKDIDENFYSEFNNSLKKHKLEDEQQRNIIMNSLLTSHCVFQNLDNPQ